MNKAFHGILEFDKSAERAYLEMEAGDAVFFHPLLVHGSGKLFWKREWRLYFRN